MLSFVEGIRAGRVESELYAESNANVETVKTVLGSGCDHQVMEQLET
jgi:hypothetical protein